MAWQVHCARDAMVHAERRGITSNLFYNANKVDTHQMHGDGMDMAMVYTATTIHNHIGIVNAR